MKRSTSTQTIRSHARAFRLGPLLAATIAATAFGCSKDEATAPSAEPPPKTGSAGEDTKAASADSPTPSEQDTATTQPVVDTPDDQAKGGKYDFESPKAAESNEPAPQAKVQQDRAAPKAGGEPTETSTPTIRGAAATGEGFRTHMQGAGSVQTGKAANVQVVLEAVAPFHCNDKYPYKFTPAPTAGVTYPQEVIRGMNVTEQRSTMSIPFTASQAGKKTLSGELAFSVCTDDKCLIEKQQLSMTVEVRDPS